MSKRQLLIVIGVLIVIVTFLGFPWGLKQFLIIIGGIIVAIIAYTMAPKVKTMRATDVPFSEHKNEADRITNPNSIEKK